MPFFRRNRRRNTTLYSRQHAHNPHRRLSHGAVAAAFILLLILMVTCLIWSAFLAASGNYMGTLFLWVLLALVGIPAAIRLRPSANT